MFLVINKDKVVSYVVTLSLVTILLFVAIEIKNKMEYMEASSSKYTIEEKHSKINQ